MDRDWMTTGRRPSGLCGAAIIIASRIHGFKRNTKQITDVVHVCDETIKRRLDEFSKTSTARMTSQDLENPEFLKEFSKSSDPPAFTRNRLKEKELLLMKKHAQDIEKSFKNPLSIKETEITENSVQENIGLSDNFNKEKITEKNTFVESEDLSEMEDNEISKYIVSHDEYKLKKLLWEILFKDWIEQQNEKKKIEKKNVKKKVRKLSRLDTTVSRDPVEAIKNSNRFGKKINFKLLNSIFVKK